MHVFNNLLHQLTNADSSNNFWGYTLDIRYLWGRVIWDLTYKQLRIVFEKIEDHLNPNVPIFRSRHTYTLHGFVYAFKCWISIWIMETFPNSSPIPGVIPHVVPYPRMRRLHTIKCERILDVINERDALGWIESVSWIDDTDYPNV
uniref:Uncharacterized protein n=1 Tax=Lactuca sativa TaxID=4236 RepID=A0A9R1VRG0_LACSA|nr:hypothetical protein LSAT_V11C400181830 [Lactuca sativa]